jgi:cytochrome c
MKRAGGIPARLRVASLLIPFAAVIFLPSLNRACAGATVAAKGTPDADRGKALFVRRCTGCHSLDQDMEGPRLRHVYGRKAGTVPNFLYSGALKAAQITWDDQTLDKWLSGTEALVPDNDMAFRVPAAAERADIIRFLKVTSEQ